MKAFLPSVLKPGTELHTDESHLYVWTKEIYNRKSVNHSKKQYSNGYITTNTIEGFWGNWKRAMSGTYHVISPKYLQHYVNEFVFRYNFRDVAICPVLLERAAKRV